MMSETIPPKEYKNLDPEKLKEFQTLEIGVEGDFGAALHEINSAMGIDLTPRDNFHITIISPPESKTLANLTTEQFSELEAINQMVQTGEGIDIKGIGYIDGATADGIRSADKEKKTCFLAFDIPALEKFRSSLGLPPKDFHITLGFVAGDIHMKIVGQDEMGKIVLGPMAKKADPNFEKYTGYLPQIKFGEFSGQEKQKKQG